ncbi:hypothetical protein P0D88_24195 [Paraburkholderia sp. RL18-103-BIB-C]|uniref:hypothetical protein n=1 Tax=unclassified Paraburkholderia TaxID=2615204 RepID=UPI0038B8B177
MPSWKAKNIELQPTTTLLDWRVMETERNERHFVGISSQSKHPQVSAVIELYDIQRRVGVTHFGQVYELLGRPRLNLEVDYAWGKWRVAKRISSFADVPRRQTTCRVI